jgi:acyl-CoA thioesterase-2
VVTHGASGAPGLLDVLSLEHLDPDLYRSAVSHNDPHGLYGGQVAAQAVRAAAGTVSPDRSVHSLHGYFLSRGDASRPVLLRVERDRDGRSYSARRVVAVQDGKVIFNLAVSFHVAEPGFDHQAHTMPPEVTPPEELADTEIETRLVDVQVRVPAQARRSQRWPTRVWARAAISLPDDTNLHACVLTYVSDMFTGLTLTPGIEKVGALTSIDHAVWFHRPTRMDDWVLMDLAPESTFGGRGMYTGRIFSRHGVLAAGIAQESMFRQR